MSVVALHSRSADRDAVATVARRVLHDVDALIPHMGACYRAEIPEYAALSDGEMDGEVLATSRRFVEEFLVRVAGGETLADVDLEVLRVAGGRRLEMGVPLDSALHAFRIAGREAWNAVVAATKEGEEHALAELAAHLLEYVDRASSAFAEGYLASSHEHLRRLDAERRAIVEALLDAADPGDVAAVAARHSLTLARTYVPVALAGGDVSARIDRVALAAPDGALAGSRGSHVIVLVPVGDDPAVDRLVDAGGADVAAVGSGAAPGSALRDEVRRVERLLAAASTSGRTGTFGPDDLLLEQLVAADEEVGAALRRRVADPLAEHDPDGIFLSTLRTYLATGSVPETARLEHIHPNTAAYRLNRVRELTGLDPRVPSQAALFVVALMEGGEAPC